MGRRPRPLAEALGRYRASLAPPTVLARVQEEWLAVAGPDVAEHSTPVAERDGLVTVRCDSSVWAAELTMMAPGLCDRFNDILSGDRPLRALKFTTTAG